MGAKNGTTDFFVIETSVVSCIKWRLRAPQKIQVTKSRRLRRGQPAINGREFAALVQNGIPALHAIQMSTINAADLLGVTDRGEIAPGKLADIIAVDGNPLENIELMEDISFVMKGGKIYKDQ